MKRIKRIEILRLSENIGRPKAIATSLKYLNEKKIVILIILLLWMETAKIIQII